MTTWWHREYDIDSSVKTPVQYLKENYLKYSDRKIAENLTIFCNRKVTKNAVKKCRYRLGLYKDDQQNDNAQNFVNEDGNYKEASVTQERPLSLEGIIGLYNVDTDVWEVDSFKVNSWEVGAKTETKNLEYINGKMSGKIQSDGLKVKQLYQTKATFLRKVPVAVNPVITPMKAQKVFSKPYHKKCGTRKALVFSDLHVGFTKDLRNAKLIPFHNRDAMNIVLSVALDMQPDRIDILGDLFDFAEWSDKFLRSPEFYWTTQPAIIELFSFLHNLRTFCPETSIFLHQGNHEKRMETAIEKHLPSAYDLRPTSKLNYPPSLSVQNLLDLESLGIHYIDDYPNDYDVLNCGLELMHGNRALKPFRTVMDVAKNSNVSKIFGHIHRLESASHTRWTGKDFEVVQAISTGCLCRLDGIVPGTSKRQQWQNGFVAIEYSDCDFNYSVVPIKNGSCIFRGLQYLSAKDNTSALKKAYPDWNW